MKNKILTVLLAITLFPIGVRAEQSYFQSELGVIEGLLNRCDSKKIETPYEDLGYQVLKKFSGYIAEDMAAGVNEAQVTYNKTYLETLYDDISENLNAYLTGEKKPFAVTPYDMSAFDNFKSKGRSVYSVGYGHGSLVREDVDEMKSFGATNIQVETGPNFIFTELPSYSTTLSAETVSYTIDNDATRGQYMNVNATGGYFVIKQTIDVEPGRTYTFGFDTKSMIGNGKLVAKVADSLRTLTGTSTVPYSWKTHSFTYTAGGDETQVEFSLEVNGTSLMYLDNLYFKDSDGNNLLYNGGFEDSYDKKHIAKLKADLERAYENNVTVCLLLSPHYFPSDLDVDGMYTENDTGFIKYNIDLPEAKAIIEEYLHALLPEIADCRAISSICLTNEPVFITWNYYDYYAPKFREWLKSKYNNSILSLYNAHGTYYYSFDRIEMPKEWGSSPLVYDWIQFNDEVFTQWHEWVADIVRSYLPDMPLHAKTMVSISSENKYGTLCHGAKPELFDSFSDWTGNDASSFSEFGGVHQDYTSDTFLSKMLWYDFLSSVTNKPVYNAEDHIIQNKNEDFDEKYAKHSRADLWQGMMHHNNMSTIWHWNRSYDSGNDAYNSVLHRPDCIYEIGKTALDLNRLSEQVDRIVNKQSKTAIFYSQASRNYSAEHVDRMLAIYKELVTLGQPVDFVMETDTSKLSQYDVLVLGGAYNTTQEAANDIKQFIANGGTVISYEDKNLTKNEYNKNASFSIKGMTSATANNLRDVLVDVLENKGLLRVKLVDESTGKLVNNIDWSFDVDGEDLVVNAMSLEGTQEFSVYLDGEKVSGLVNAIENKEFTGVAEEFVPVLLKTPTGTISEKVKVLSVDGKTVMWTSNDPAYHSANIYRISGDWLELIENTTAFSYTAVEDASIIIKACDYNGNESEGVSVGFEAEQRLSTYIQDGKAYVRNTTDKIQAGVLSVNLTDSEGTVLKCSQMTFMLRPNERASMYITFSAKNGEQITTSISNMLD